MMKIGVLLLNFGEPEEPTMEAVVPFLERIFSLNTPLLSESAESDAAIRERSRAMAAARAPGLIAEYEEIGGSPLHQQAREQGEALQHELDRRGYDSLVLLGMQFTDPSIGEAVRKAREAGVTHLVSLPIYPLCGRSTNVAALLEVDHQLDELAWEVPGLQITGWHRHPAYLRVRANAIRRVLEENSLTFEDPATRLIFSAHGTPVRYLEDGNRYGEYVEEFCSALAAELKVQNYLIGYQNHTNRPGVEWTQPDIERVIEDVDAERVVVDAVSFMHEQSETLAELDDELREEAEGRGLGFFRVPIPHLDGEFITLLADLVDEAVRRVGPEGAAPSSEPIELFQCRCKPTVGAVCTNARP